MSSVKPVTNYEPAIVTFIDILGFGDLVSKESASTIEKKLKLLHEVNKGDTGEDFDAKVFQFSDCILRVRRVHTDMNKQMPLGLVFWELLDLLQIQAELIKLGVFLRGGVTYGDISIVDERVFGPSVVQAYKLEAQLAIYPRIIIDPALFAELKRNNLLRSHENTAIQEKTYIKDIIRFADDGIWFIDYAKASEHEFDGPEYYKNFLVDHKKYIVQNAKVHKQLNSVSGKYLWLANYHNNVIDGFDDTWFNYHGIKRSSLKINSREINTIQKL